MDLEEIHCILNLHFILLFTVFICIYRQSIKNSNLNLVITPLLGLLFLRQSEQHIQLCF